MYLDAFIDGLDAYNGVQMNIKVLITKIVGIICSMVLFFATASQFRKVSWRRLTLGGETNPKYRKLHQLTGSYTSTYYLFLTLHAVPADLLIVSDLQTQGHQMWHRSIVLRCE